MAPGARETARGCPQIPDPDQEAGMDMTPLITKQISLDEIAENLKMLQTDREECKITVTDFD